ncbi:MULTISPECIES: thioredoxin family protein [Butyricimonas]|uniref:thioredoxin family protein n=1 Tax=Butyricimonas TaxID=574697 RepID=UPI001D0835A6|nr:MULTISPECIES: thioredoxin family protein [Butyricimonas]MCB6973890.1 thioredoxin family protein [Butyricimonas synergistica]MCG4520767.1 thioredoxin family protein [Butyricimonas sp. DFI.6.44]
MKKIWYIIATCMMLQTGVFAQTNFEDLTLAEALEKAKIEKKLVFVDVYTSWCMPCKYMAMNVFPQNEMGEYMNSRFVCVKYDTGDKEGADIMKRYQVSSYPTFLILNTRGEVQHRLAGGSETVADFIKRVDEGLNEDTAIGVLAKRYEEGERDVHFLANYARALLAVDDVKVLEVADVLLKGLNDEQRVDTAYWFIYEHPALTPVGSPNMNYLLAHASRFQKSIGEECVNEKIATAFDLKLTNMITGRDRQSGVAAIDAIEKEMEGYRFPSKPRLKMFAQIARAQRSGDVEKLLETCEECIPRIEHEHLLAIFFPLSQTIKREGNKKQQERILKLAKNLLAETTNDKFKFSLGQFIPYVLEK